MLAACADKPSAYTQAQAPGHFVIFNQKCYAEQQLRDLDNLDVDQIRTRFTTAGWTLSRDLHDGNCPQGGRPAFNASQLTDSTTNNSDFVWYSGHGVDNGVDFGLLVFYDYFLSDGCQNRRDRCFNRRDIGLPFTGPNLKWFFANASFSVERPPYDWLSAFSQSGNGLHGFYGYELEPSDTYGAELGREFADAAIQSSSNPHPVPIRTAWIDAARANHHGDAYGVFELQSANQDQISGGSSNPPYTPVGQFRSDNPVIFYDAAGSQAYYPNQTQSLSTQSPGSYQPRVLQPEGWSDSYLSGLARQNGSTPVEIQLDSNQHRFLDANYTADHFEGSGAVLIRTQISTMAMSWTQADAQQYSVDQISQHGGMPADAVLQYVVVHYSTQTAPTSAAPVVIGYDFIYRHSDGTMGGDMIDVGVDNIHHRECIEPNPNDPPYDKPACLRWDFTPALRSNYLYRLWRSRSSTARYPLGINPGTPMLAPSQAFQFAVDVMKGNSQSLGTFVGYNQSYCTMPYDSTDNTAYPAYNFYYSSHHVLSVDALSGAILGTSRY